MTNEKMIDGPASPIASPMTTKMPVPMMAPRPSAVRSSTPTARWSWWPCSSVSPTSASTGLVMKNPECEPLRPSLPTAMRGLLFVRRGDDEDGAARALHELERDAAQHATGDGAAPGRARDDHVGLALLREQQDAA